MDKEELDSSAAVSQAPLPPSNSPAQCDENAAIQGKEGMRMDTIPKEKVTLDKTSEGPPPEGPPHEYPGGLKLITIIIGLCLAVFLVALDNTIIATAIPKITDAF